MLTLYRYRSSEEVTQGIVFSDGVYVADSLELPWLENSEFISCIPEGEYEIKWEEDKHQVGPCYEVLNVSGRMGVLIHSANSVDELEGCIGVGVKAVDEIWSSKLTLRHIHEAVGDSSRLKITSKFGV